MSAEQATTEPAAKEGGSKPYSFIDFEPLYEATFFKELARKKIEDWKLDDKPQMIHGVYQSSKFSTKQPKLNFSHFSFNLPSISTSGPYETHLRGKLILYNTKEEYEASNVQTVYGSHSSLTSRTRA